MLVLRAVTTLQVLTLAMAPQAIADRRPQIAPGELMGLGAALLEGDFSPPDLLLRSRSVARTHPPALTNATVALALATMNFHRRMMNEYLCRGYMAEDILEQLKRDAESKEPAWKPHSSTKLNRMGEPSISIKKHKINNRAKMMLDDEGSMNYRGWLERSAVLQDVYRHFEDDEVTALEVQARGDDGEEEVEEEPPEPPKSKGPSSKGPRIKSKGNKKTKGPSYEDSATSHSHREPEYIDFPPDDVSDGGGGGSHAVGFNMKDFYDITLTAVAFLAFGIFIFNVFMGIFMTKPSTQTVVVSNTSLPVVQRTGFISNFDDDPVHERIARWAEEPPLSRIETGEEIVARLALLSLNAALKPFKSSCLQAALCKGNKMSRDIDGQAKYWLPIWSLGISWLAERGGGDVEPGSASLFSGALENLRASTLGLAGVRCQELFPDC